MEREEYVAELMISDKHYQGKFMVIHRENLATAIYSCECVCKQLFFAAQVDGKPDETRPFVGCLKLSLKL
jgi:hypothetical protein